MKNCNALENPTRSRILRVAGATALAVAFTVALPQPAHAGNTAFLEGHAVGTQNYLCLPCPNATTPAAMCPDTSGFAWIRFTPQATLFRDNGSDTLTATTFIQRLNISGGAAPPTGCASSTDVGAKAFVPYTADYFFHKAHSATEVAKAARGNMNGAAGQMPAFYEGELFTVNMKEMPNSDPLLEHNPSVNEIYASNDLDDEQDFIPVINAIQGEGFNPLWQQILIVFNQGFTPHQFFSEEEIETAAAGGNPEITLVETDEVYRCSVVGSPIK